MDFAAEFNRYKTLTERYLTEALNSIYPISDRLFDAVKYSLLGGGKRLRPILFLAIYDFFSCSSMQAGSYITAFESALRHGFSKHTVAESKNNTHPAQVKYVACAIEMLHTYTLIHDDLPCIDNDDFRRGSPSCHKRFDEATALLAGDALLNLCYEFLFKAATLSPQIVYSLSAFSSLLGIEGLVGGQAKELFNNSKSQNLSQIAICDLISISKADMLKIYKNKTASLFKAAALMGASCSGCNEDKTEKLLNYAENFGMAFQLKDDLADNNKDSFAFCFGKKYTSNLAGEYSLAALEIATDLKFEFLEKLVNFENFLS